MPQPTIQSLVPRHNSNATQICVQFVHLSISQNCYTPISLCPVREDTFLSKKSQYRKGYGLELADAIFGYELCLNLNLRKIIFQMKHYIRSYIVVGHALAR